MRTFDLAPLYRSTVGFDRLFDMLDAGSDAAPGYPPYNIERTGENDYRITVAVAGFGENELSIEAKENTLTIKGEKQAKEDKAENEVLYQGIAARAFERVFQLADHVRSRAPRSRTVSCTSTSCARSPKRRSRARSRSATASRQVEGRRRQSCVTWRPNLQAKNLQMESAPDAPGRFFIAGLIRAATIRWSAGPSSPAATARLRECLGMAARIFRAQRAQLPPQAQVRGRDARRSASAASA